MSAGRLRLVGSAPRPSPAERTWAWPLVIALAAVIGVAVPLLLGGCAEAPALPEPVRVQTDQQRCEARGALWAYVSGRWHCLVSPVAK